MVLSNQVPNPHLLVCHIYYFYTHHLAGLGVMLEYLIGTASVSDWCKITNINSQLAYDHHKIK